MEEIYRAALLLTVFGLLMALSVLATRAIERLGVPVVLLFLLIGMLGGSEGLVGFSFDDYQSAFRAGTAALILILLVGGFSAPTENLKISAGPAIVLATVGVAGTAAAI